MIWNYEYILEICKKLLKKYIARKNHSCDNTEDIFAHSS